VQRPHEAVAGPKEEEVNISQTTLRIGAVLGTIGAIVVLAASAQAATSKPAGMSRPEYALMVRSEALNKLYGLDRTSQPTKVVEQPTRSGDGFGWGDFGIGAAAMLGLVLLSGGLLAGPYWRKIGVRPRSVS